MLCGADTSPDRVVGVVAGRAAAWLTECPFPGAGGRADVPRHRKVEGILVSLDYLARSEAEPPVLPPQSQQVPATLDHQAHLVQHVASEDGIVPSLWPSWAALRDTDADVEAEPFTALSVR